MIKLYFLLQNKIVNPILFVNSQLRMDAVLEDMKSGETTVRSSIEDAMMKDAIHETLTGKQSDLNLKKVSKFQNMIAKFVKLIIQMFSSNLDIVCYMSMMITTFISPGLITMVYPLSIFGYAIPEETRPGTKYWLFIVLYT